MRKTLIVVATLLLSACQTKTHSPGSNTTAKIYAAAHHPSSQNKSIYERYKNQNNRYLIQQDGAPSNKVGVNFKELTPTKEPLSRYGNPTEYYVDGRNYQVMKSSTGYKTRGIASWYGTKFHKQRTSSGEPYDMYVLTAAHKTLPLPTYIRVKNLDNGRMAIVKVNDRGPFHADRVVDLSYAAALKLGVFPKGTAHVEIETLMGPAGVAHYYVQAGAFASEELAKGLKAKLAHITPSPVFIEHYQKHFIVRVGPFANKIMSDAFKKKLTGNGVNGAFSVLV
jgi:rare lipoprotein A